MVDDFHIFDRNTGKNGIIKIGKLLLIDNISHIYIPLSLFFQ